MARPRVPGCPIPPLAGPGKAPTAPAAAGRSKPNQQGDGERERAPPLVHARHGPIPRARSSRPGSCPARLRPLMPRIHQLAAPAFVLCRTLANWTRPRCCLAGVSASLAAKGSASASTGDGGAFAAAPGVAAIAVQLQAPARVLAIVTAVAAALGRRAITSRMGAFLFLFVFPHDVLLGPARRRARVLDAFTIRQDQGGKRGIFHNGIRERCAA